MSKLFDVLSRSFQQLAGIRTVYRQMSDVQEERLFFRIMLVYYVDGLLREQISSVFSLCLLPRWVLVPPQIVARKIAQITVLEGSECIIIGKRKPFHRTAGHNKVFFPEDFVHAQLWSRRGM